MKKVSKKVFIEIGTSIVSAAVGFGVQVVLENMINRKVKTKPNVKSGVVSEVVEVSTPSTVENVIQYDVPLQEV